MTMTTETLVRELRERAQRRSETEGPFTKENLVEYLAATRLAEQEAVIAERDAEIARWQNNWDANVQEMSEKFRAVNIARVIEATGADIFDLSEKAQRLESELSLVSARLAEAEGLIERARMNTSECYVNWHEAARAFLNPDTEVTK